jgi:hypothetical protein
MGQPVVVTEKPSRRTGVVRFEANRSLSGMGHESFTSGESLARLATAQTSSAELARRLFATGRVARVHVYQNIITVDLVHGQSSDGLADVVRDLYQYWKPGMEPPAFEDLVAPEESAAAATASDSAGGPAVDSRVPAHLLERSRLARERWNSR